MYAESAKKAMLAMESLKCNAMSYFLGGNDGEVLRNEIWSYSFSTNDYTLVTKFRDVDGLSCHGCTMMKTNHVCLLGSDQTFNH